MSEGPTLEGGRRFSRPLAAGLAIVGTTLALSLLIPAVSRASPIESDFIHGLSAAGVPVGPSQEHLLGVDRLFRDLLVRLAAATRLSLGISFASAAAAVTIGACVGAIAGFFRALDSILMRLVDTGLSLPFVVVILGLSSGVDRMTPLFIVFMLTLTGWFGPARLIRSQMLVLREQEFVHAARALGGGALHVLVRHIIPNLARPAGVLLVTLIPQMIMSESALGFLGAGLPPPTATLGQLLYEGKDAMTAAPWILLAPALTLSATLFGLHLIGRSLAAKEEQHGS